MPIETPTISIVKNLTKAVDTAIILLGTDKKLGKVATGLDKHLGGLISHHISSHPNFKADAGQTLIVTLPQKADYLRIVVLGLGDLTKSIDPSLEIVGGKLAEILYAHGSVTAGILNADDIQKEVFAHIFQGLRLGSYRFDAYKTIKKDNVKQNRLKTLQVAGISKDLAKAATQSDMVAQSVALVRDLVNEPPNKLYPENFATQIKKTLTPLGVKVTILDDKALIKQGMGLIMAVGQASEHLPRLVIMEWPGTGTSTAKTKSNKDKPLAFVGKGITFDCGGLNVKPYEGMLDMKMDMGGAATVVGLMKLLATRKCPKSVVGVVALAENAISDEATRPSDIITSYSGKTVEILNTDAEGRLVLADALTYVQKKYDPSLVINLATLTGAIMISLGLDYAGAFVNNNELWTKLESSSAASGEKIWRMPLDKSFRREMDSVFADIRNVGNGRYGGSCTAAAFLSEFIDADRPWAHLDIAGVAMSKAHATCPVPFASGYGVKLLNRFVEDFYG